MFYIEDKNFGVSYRVAVFPHPDGSCFSYHSEIAGIPIQNPVYPDRGTSIGCYGSAKDAFNWGRYHTEGELIVPEES